MVSILMLVYNAPHYVEESIETVHSMTSDVEYELVVVDNASNSETKELLQKLYDEKKIDKLYFNPLNSLFAGGNNIASRISSPNSDYYLLLNSDICIKNPAWLAKLVNLHQNHSCGATAYGAVLATPIRADGYCLLVNKELYDKYLLDENYAWFWGVTKLESQILADGFNIIAVKEHEKYIHHYGGGSGDAFKNAKGMDTEIGAIIKWFNLKKKVEIYKSMDSPSLTNHSYNLWCYLLNELKSIKYHITNNLKKIFKSR